MLLLSGLSVSSSALSPQYWNCLGPVSESSNCPSKTEPGNEMMMENGLASDPQSNTVFTVSWTYTCWYNPRPNGWDEGVNWINDFDPVWCPTFECGTRWDNPCRQPVLVPPGRWCPAQWIGGAPMCPTPSGEYAVDRSVNGTGIWLSAFSGSDASRLWRVRIDGWSTPMSSSTASCIGSSSLRVIGSTVVLQCLLMLQSTGDVLQSTLLFGVDTGTGTQLWKQLLGIAPVLSSGSPAWTQSTLVSKANSSFQAWTEVRGGGRYQTLQYASHYTPLFAPRWCVQQCLQNPACTAWTLLRRQYDQPLCYLYSGTTSLSSISLGGSFQMSGLMTARPSYGQLCTTITGGVCAPRFQYTDSSTNVYIGQGCKTSSQYYPFPSMPTPTDEFCCTTPVCAYNQNVGHCSACTACVLPNSLSGPVARVLDHNNSQSLFIPDSVGSYGIQINARTGESIRLFDSNSAEWRASQNSSTCFGGQDLIPGFIPPILADLPNGVTLMIGRSSTMHSRLVATNVKTGMLAWTYDLPINQFEWERSDPGFMGFGKPDYLYYTAMWMGRSAPCNLVVFRISATSLTYENRFPVDRVCWTTYDRYFSAGNALGGVDPGSGRLFFLADSPSTLITYDPAKQQVVQTPWLTSDNVVTLSWKPFSDALVAVRVTVGYPPSSSILVLMSIASGQVSARLANRESNFDFIDYGRGADDQSIATTSNGNAAAAGTSRVVVWRNAPSDDVQLSGASKVIVIAFAAIASIGNLILVILKAGVNARKIHDKYVQMDGSYVQMDDDNKNSNNKRSKKWELAVILVSIFCSAAVLVASSTQKGAVNEIIHSWRDDISLSTFPQFQQVHIRSCSTSLPSYNTDLCTCTPSGPCQDKAFLQSCGVMRQPTCSDALTNNCACDLALYGYTCACSVEIGSCTILVQPNSNGTQKPSYLPTATQGFDQCATHYDSIATTLDRTLLGIVLVSIGAILFEFFRVFVFFKKPASFGKASVLSSVVSFVCMIATSVMIANVPHMTFKQACTAKDGFLTVGLPGCSLVNMGVVSSAEENLIARIDQCIRLFVASPVMLGLQGAFVFLQQLAYLCKR